MAPFTRNDLALGAIALASCIGAAHAVLGSANARLERAIRADAHAQAIARDAEENASRHATAMKLTDALRNTVESIQRSNAHAENAATLYDQYALLADSLGLTVVRMGPTAPTGSSPSPGTRIRGSSRSADGANGTNGTHGEPIAFVAEVDGPIEAVAVFLDAIEHELGHTRIISARLTPIGIRTTPPGEQQPLPVRLAIMTLHHRFSMPDIPPTLLTRTTADQESNP